MGRYTTVQAYADNNQNMRSVSYEQATGSDQTKTGAVRPEKVDNPYGSTAGAGSGDFHVYRHARAREMARMKRLDEEEAEREADADFNKKISEWKSEEDQRTEKRRRKRQREKEAKLRKKNMKLGGVAVAASGSDKNIADNAVDEEEFHYTPIHAAIKGGEGGPKNVGPKDSNRVDDDDPKKVSSRYDLFANDGSFLEMMKTRLADEAKREQAPNQSLAMTGLIHEPKEVDAHEEGHSR
uniref:Uncharacterized protein n=1 Tax=Trieres chinensis TaxID=1514140 RepID=A0A7S2E6Z0_TRICV|mmetsp:Transcript_10413/g.21872  ORF Transcript_10413/g.21872 Transcript_10413/m.21872 type:complete len:239 (+) Transcript_10413:106-822(+)|eukprot:CAMPEP_0183309750 /NCGR_PEP_ID=MMETSP0160_2-20130417/25523_1 /TAXON_ID=2839 ORGANISM="Odontella Sinensis, Strain Grunow 1884" /NCGR_SAMPLE_ID=MMETSP0160_2 /ASSEMBLY_ACC=CAM_ASM_000250 /LENGTH=238 /DNA_ID=CAMNT_0025473821 /DNA_START=104 /DNA_END=820 /DNA_ORIENTATION=+